MPQPPRNSTSPPHSGPNRFQIRSLAHPDGTRERHQITVPRSRYSTNRAKGAAAVITILKRAQHQHQRFHALIRIEVGPPRHRQRHDIPIGSKGGYDPTRTLEAIQHTGDVWAWAATQLHGRHPNLTSHPWTITGITLDTW